jgi:hypothetical protein
MFMSIRRSVATLFAVVCLTLVGGCQTSSPPAPDTSKAVVVNTGQGTSVVYLSSTDGTVHTMSTEGAGVCKQCETDALAYFKTGHLDPVCQVCGAKRAALVAQTTTGHQ